MTLPNLPDFSFKHVDQPDRPNVSATTRKQQWDSQVEEIRDFINNSLTAILNSVADGSSGADNIAMTPLAETGVAATVQAVVEALVTRLKSVAGGASGADLVGATGISGLSGATVQALLAALKQYIDVQVDAAKGAPASIDGVDNKKGDIDLVAGTGISITPNNTAKTVTITGDPLKTYTDTELGNHANATTAHGSASAATAGAIMQRDASGRAKVAAPSASDDIARKDTVDAVQTNLTNHDNLTTVHSATSLATADRIIVRDANGRAKVAAPAASDDIARKDTVDAHGNRTDNPHNVTAAQAGAIAQVGGISNPGGNVAIAGGTGISVGTNPDTKTVTITATGTAVPGPHAAEHGMYGTDPITPALIGAAGAAALDAHTNATTVHSATSLATADRIIVRDANGRAKVAAPSASDDIARKDTVDAHGNRTDNPHNVTAAQAGAADIIHASRHASGGDDQITPDDINAVPLSHVGSGGTVHAVVVAGGAAGFISGADKTKLDGIEVGATADQSANEILTALLTVDGSSSGLDADKLDGQEGSYYAVSTHNHNSTYLALAGGNMTGVLTCRNATDYTTKQARNITLSTGDPSGGGNGDVWLKYT